MSDSTHELINQIRTVNKKYRRACEQILILNNCLEVLQKRYDRAMKVNRRSFRYSLRLRLATYEGVRNMFYEYASRQADDLEEMQARLMQESGGPGMFNLSDSDDSDNYDEESDGAVDIDNDAASSSDTETPMTF